MDMPGKPTQTLPKAHDHSLGLEHRSKALPCGSAPSSPQVQRRSLLSKTLRYLNSVTLNPKGEIHHFPPMMKSDSCEFDGHVFPCRCVASHLTWSRETRAPFWTQEGSSWWPGLVWYNLEKLHGATTLCTHHLQGSSTDPIVDCLYVII